jgi:hypothetical protein
MCVRECTKYHPTTTATLAGSCFVIGDERSEPEKEEEEEEEERTKEWGKKNERAKERKKIPIITTNKQTNNQPTNQQQQQTPPNLRIGNCVASDRLHCPIDWVLGSRLWAAAFAQRSNQLLCWTRR